MHPSSRTVLPGARSYSPEIESLRGLAIALVVGSHADGLLTGGVRIGEGPFDPLLAFVDSGHTGVTLFFVLSGFLLSQPFIAELRGGPRVSLSHFAVRRALRILPMYWLAVALSIALHRSLGADLGDALGYALFLNSFAGLVTSLPMYSSVWWSLATEVQFYLALALLAMVLRLRGGWILCSVLAALHAFAYIRCAHAGFAPDSNLSLSLFGRAPVFALGVLAAALHARYGESIRLWSAHRRWLRIGGADALLIATFVALAFLLQAVSVSGFYVAEAVWHTWHLTEAVLWTCILLLLLLAPLRLRVAIDNAGMRELGRISYSVYLVHLPVLSHMISAIAPDQTWTFSGSSAVALALAITLAVSELTYRWIERPFLARKPRPDAGFPGSTREPISGP